MHKPLPFLAAAFAALTLVAAPAQVSAQAADCNPAVVQQIRRDVEKALSEPDIAQRYTAFGFEPFPATPEQFAGYVKSESTRFADIIKKANVTLD